MKMGWCAVLLAICFALTGIGDGQCRQDIQPGRYWIKVRNEDGTVWCLDRDRFDQSHYKLVYSACLHPESMYFDVKDPGNAGGCYQIRPAAEDGAGNNYHMLMVISGPEADRRGWTPVLSSLCSDQNPNCSHNDQTWAIQSWNNGTYKIRSNVPVEGAPQGYCIDKRDDSGEGAPEPQFKDCEDQMHQQYWFQPVSAPVANLRAKRATRSAAKICTPGETWVCKESMPKPYTAKPQSVGSIKAQ